MISSSAPRLYVPALFVMGPLLALAVLASGPSGCGRDVDLGGSADVSVPTFDGGAEGAGPGVQCAPCLTATDCASGLCAKFADDLFCTTSCSTSSPCATGQTCSSLLTSAGAKVSACLPDDTKCAPENGPPGPDGAPLEHCGELDAPWVSSTCKACGSDTDDCQPNGCYGGYWCDSDHTDCETPPKTCP